MKIFLSGNLTPYNQHLAWMCRELKWARRIHSCWSSKGVVKILVWWSLLNCTPCFLKTSSQDNVPCILMCQCAHVPVCLACLHALRAYVLTCQRALHAHVLTCQCALHAHVLTCLHALRAYILTCQHVLQAYMPCTLTWSHANMPYVTCVLTCSCVCMSCVIDVNLVSLMLTSNTFHILL